MAEEATQGQQGQEQSNASGTQTPETQAPSSNTNLVDTSKLSPEDLQKMIDQEADRRVSQALKKEKARKEAEAEAAKKKAEAEDAKKRGDFEALEQQLKAEKDALAERLALKSVDSQLTIEAIKQGIIDEDGLRFIGKDELKACLNDDDSVNKEAVQKALEVLKSSKSYLFKEVKPEGDKSFKGAPSPGSGLPSAAPGPDLGNLTTEQYAELRNSRLDKMKNPKANASDALLDSLLQRGK